MIDKLAGTFGGGLMAEIKAHPYTTLTSMLALGVALVAVTTRAPANDVQSLNVTVSEIRVSLLEKGILDTKIAYCRATQKLFLTTRLAEQLREYQRTTGREFRVPACEELGT